MTPECAWLSLASEMGDMNLEVLLLSGGVRGADLDTTLCVKMRQFSSDGKKIRIRHCTDTASGVADSGAKCKHIGKIPLGFRPGSVTKKSSYFL